MLTTADFLLASKWAGILTLVFGAIAILTFVFKAGIRFRMIGVTGFMLVLTGGLFALGLGFSTRVQIPGAVPYTLVYDNGASQAAIAVPADISEAALEATLHQAAINLSSFGRSGEGNQQELSVRARTILHPEPGVSQLLYLGQAKQPLSAGKTDFVTVEIDRQSFKQLAS